MFWPVPTHDATISLKPPFWKLAIRPVRPPGYLFSCSINAGSSEAEPPC